MYIILMIVTERRKWIYQFENVNILIYVASLMAFNEPLFEDAATNSLIDCLALFEEHINSDNFQETANFILLLNKTDFFAQEFWKKMDVKN